jgi:hypothetical protein
MSDNTGLPAIMENNSGEQKNSRNMRPHSLSHRILNAPVVHNIVQSLSISEHTSVKPPASLSFH